MKKLLFCSASLVLSTLLVQYGFDMHDGWTIGTGCFAFFVSGYITNDVVKQPQQRSVGMGHNRKKGFREL